MGKNKFRLSHRKVTRSRNTDDNQLQGPCNAFTQTDDTSTQTDDAFTQTDDTSIQMDDTYTQTDDATTPTDKTIIVACQRDEVTVTSVTTQTDTSEMNDCSMEIEVNHQHLMSPIPGSHIVKIPLEVFLSQRIVSLNQLHSRLASLKCVRDWFLMSCSNQMATNVRLVRVNGQDVLTLDICDQLKWSLNVAGNCVPSSTLFTRIPSLITSLQDLEEVVAYIEKCVICKGNGDPKFMPLVTKCKGLFKDRNGTKVNAYFDTRYLTIRHTNCEWLLEPNSHKLRCTVCSQYRESYLRSKMRSLENHTKEASSASCSASSHTNYRYLDTPEKLQKIKNLQALVVKQRKKLNNIEMKLKHYFHSSGVCIQNDISDDMAELIRKYSESSGDSDDESFQSIFWKQQLKNLSLKNKKQIRWHPLIIRWALYLHHRSSGAYEVLRNSGVITLPSTRTLCDYRHFTSTKSGFSEIADLQLLELVKQKKHSLSKYVFLLLDEMYLKEGLVYDKGTGSLIGFSDLGGVIQEVKEYEEAIASDTSPGRSLAKTMMVFMVRGIFTDIKFPYAQFPMTSGTGYDLFPLLWQAIDRLECNGIHVIGVTSDGASINRKLFRLHSPAEKLVYKTTNMYTKRSVFFFSDPPHLLKTIRNAFASPIRNLWCNGQSISWEFIRKLYERNTGMPNSKGVSMVHKLKLEHINLTSFSKMRVDLAAQVMSNSVSQALYLMGGSEAFETAYFIGKVNNFFDCLNVPNYTTGIYNRKPFLMPYCKPDDWRLQYLREFLMYFDDWKKSVMKRSGYDDKERSKMMIPQETRDGIYITVSSFVEMVPFLLKIPHAACFFSSRINQDPLEKFFGMQRQSGKSNENPTAAEFIKNTENFRVISSIWVDTITGNCRGRKSKEIDIVAAKQPLRKRSRRRRSSS